MGIDLDSAIASLREAQERVNSLRAELHPEAEIWRHATADERIKMMGRMYNERAAAGPSPSKDVREALDIPDSTFNYWRRLAKKAGLIDETIVYFGGKLVEVDEIGPSLRYATAQVTRTGGRGGDFHIIVGKGTKIP